MDAFRAQLLAEVKALVLAVERLKPTPPDEAAVSATVDKFEANTWARADGNVDAYRAAMEKKTRMLRDALERGRAASPTGPAPPLPQAAATAAPPPPPAQPAAPPQPIPQQHPQPQPPPPQLPQQPGAEAAAPPPPRKRPAQPAAPRLPQAAPAAASTTTDAPRPPTRAPISSEDQQRYRAMLDERYRLCIRLVQRYYFTDISARIAGASVDKNDLARYDELVTTTERELCARLCTQSARELRLLDPTRGTLPPLGLFDIFLDAETHGQPHDYAEKTIRSVRAVCRSLLANPPTVVRVPLPGPGGAPSASASVTASAAAGVDAGAKRARMQ